MATILPIKANIYGPVFSCLLYDNVRCAGDQEGFLLGHISERMLDSVNDTQINSQQQEITIDIQAILSCESPYTFYNNCGEIDKNKMTEMLKNEKKDIVGWYRFRRNSPLEPLFLERMIHNNLVSILPNEGRYFLLALFTAFSNSNLSTHSFDHALLCLTERSEYEAVPLLVTNLGGGSQADYKDHQTLRPDCKALETTEIPNTAMIMQKIQTSLESNLKHLSLQVSESENSLQQARREIELLKTQLHIRNKTAESPDGSGFLTTVINSKVSDVSTEASQQQSAGNVADVELMDTECRDESCTNSSEWIGVKQNSSNSTRP